MEEKVGNGIYRDTLFLQECNKENELDTKKREIKFHRLQLFRVSFNDYRGIMIIKSCIMSQQAKSGK